MMLEKKQIILIAAGVGLGLLSLVMLKVYIDQQRRLALEDAQRKAESAISSNVTVLVARKDISAGSRIDEGSVSSEIMPRQMLQPQAVTSVASISGMVATIPISRGEQITLNKLQYPQGPSQQGSSLASSTPVGKRAVTIQADNIASLAGMIKPGDYVDVVAILPQPMQTSEGKQVMQTIVVPLFQNVLILAVGRETGTVLRAAATGRYKQESSAPPPEREISSLITIALSPQEASLVAYVQEQGKIRLFLRSQADAEPSSVQMVTPANVAQFLQSVMPPPQGEAKKIKPESQDTVEIIKGSKKEQMPITK
jgi:pilus assembly protein CpaB